MAGVKGFGSRGEPSPPIKMKLKKAGLVTLVCALILLFLIIKKFNIVGNVVRFENFGPVKICNDSDGGRDFFTAGYVRSKGINYYDFCQGANVLIEYYCLKGIVKTENKSCSDFDMVCFEGKCFAEEENFFILAEGTDLALAYSFIVSLNALGYQFDNSIIRNYTDFERIDISDNLLLAIYDGEASVIVGQDLIDDDIELGALVHRIANTLNLRNTVVSDMEVNYDNLREIFPISSSWPITQITDDGYFNEYVTLHDYYPNIWAGRVIWLRTVPLDNGYGSLDQVFMYELGTMKQISNITNAGTSEPDSWGRNAVWFNYFTRPTFSEIYLYEDDIIKKITNNRNFNLTATSTRVSGDNVVWVAHNGSNINDLYFYDGMNINKLAVEYNNIAPALHGNFIAWERWIGGKSEIYFYDGNRMSRLTNNNYDDRGVSIWKNYVAWHGFRRNTADSDIFYYDGSTVRQLTQTNKNSNPVVWGNNVAWTGTDSDGRWQIYFYDGTLTKEITSYTNRDSSPPEMWGDIIVWTSVRSDINEYDEAEKTREIYLYDGKEVYRITDNAYQDISPVVWGENIAWLGKVDSEDEYEIFFAYRP
mgnify:CR=1 FL=1